jgi:hypothetical protein
MRVTDKHYTEFLDVVKNYTTLHGTPNIEQIRILAKDLALSKRNNINDLICRRYYYCVLMTYCLNNNITLPEGFVDNMYDPDNEFTNDPNTQKAIQRDDKHRIRILLEWREQHPLT